MWIFKTKWFTRYGRRESISDDMLLDAIIRAERGLVDADLGKGLIKQRVARSGQGRSGGFRTLIAFHRLNRSVFIYGFAKNERDNIDDDELETLQDVAADWLKANDPRIDEAVALGLLVEVESNVKKID